MGWRKANVTPVLKKGKKEDLENYRPVSLTSIPGKVMEQPILGVISKHVEEEVVTRGFTKGQSCLTNPIAFYDGMNDWVDEGRAVAVLYLDFSKAFDTICHNILTGQLRKCGLDEWTVYMGRARGTLSCSLPGRHEVLPSEPSCRMCLETSAMASVTSRGHWGPGKAWPRPR